jgi:uncharacterized protein YuzE
VHLLYFKQDDVLHLVISEEPECGSVELTPNVTAELNQENKMIGIEILNASSVTTSHYYPATESLYIETSSDPSVDTREVCNGIVLDYSADGKLVGIGIE